MSNVFWKAWAIVFVLSVFWLGWCLKTSAPAQAQAGTPEVIQARSFEVVDDEGRVRAALRIVPDGSPSLLFLDAHGKPRALLNTDPDGAAGLALYDAGGKPRALLSIFPDGTPVLGLFDGSRNVLFSAP